MAANQTKKKKFPIFWTAYFLFLTALIIFWLFVLRYVNDCLLAYENAQPERVVEALAQDLQDGQAETVLTFSLSENRFQDPDLAKKRYLSYLAGKEITYDKDPGSYDAQNPIYRLYADGRQIATVSLRELSSKPLMLILSMQEWEVVCAEAILETGEKDLLIYAPDNCTVLINGIEADERERNGEEHEIKEFAYAAEYTSVPKLVEYEITGLFEQPEIEIFDSFGEKMEYTQTDNIIEATVFPASEIDGQLAEYVLQNAINYSNFFSRDLPGCQKSVAPLRSMFPEGSEFLELADNYRKHDMWMYSGHATPTFSNERVTDYVRYSEDFFSCNVYFEKKMLLTKTGATRTVVTNDTYYYVRIDGKWVIADMRTILEEE